MPALLAGNAAQTIFKLSAFRRTSKQECCNVPKYGKLLCATAYTLQLHLKATMQSPWVWHSLRQQRNTMEIIENKTRSRKKIQQANWSKCFMCAEEARKLL